VNLLIGLASIFFRLNRARTFRWFRPLELRLFNEFYGHLPKDAARILRTQVLLTAQVLRYPRLSNEVLMYSPKWIRIPLFPAQYSDRTFATVTFHIDGVPDSTNRVRFINVNGHCFSMVYSKHPSWKARHFGKPVIDKIKLHYDLMVEAHDPEPAAADASFTPVFAGWLRGWQERYTLRSLMRPVTKARRRERLKELNVTPPKDYLELIDQTDGMTVEQTSVLGVEEMYEVELASGTHVLLAEIHTPDAEVLFLTVKGGARDGNVYTFDCEQADYLERGPSFREAVEKYLPTCIAEQGACEI
jgi:hypothetical protein